MMRGLATSDRIDAILKRMEDSHPCMEEMNKRWDAEGERQANMPRYRVELTLTEMVGTPRIEIAMWHVAGIMRSGVGEGSGGGGGYRHHFKITEASK